MLRVAVLLLTLPVAASAQQSAHRASSITPIPAGVVRSSVTPPSAFDTAHISATRPIVAAALSRDSTRAAKLQHYTVIGLGAGAVSGVVGGLVGSRYMGCGCSDAAKGAAFALWFGAVGAGVGGIIGAVIGAIHDYRP
jgi:hypothetical protein